MITPNIFQIATTELSQDAFFCWLINWADPQYAGENPKLHQAAQRFVLMLMEGRVDASKFEFKSVFAKRQHQRIDIWVEVESKSGEKFLIIIEDKTGAGQHGDQLSRYKEIAEKHCSDHGYKTPICIYLKTGNESVWNKGNTEKQGYKYLTRAMILAAMGEAKTGSDIADSFLTHIAGIEAETNSFDNLKLLQTSWYATEGFYQYLQEKLQSNFDWRYVSNPNGGFLGGWYHWVRIRNEPVIELYLQLENKFKNGMQLVLRVYGAKSLNSGDYYDMLHKLQKLSQELNLGLQITKPARFGSGETVSIAIVLPNFDSIATPEDFLAISKKAQLLLEKYAERYGEVK
jgi:hypothetical protein